eukprot:403346197
MLSKALAFGALALTVSADQICQPGQYLLNGACEQVPQGCYQTVADAVDFFNCPSGHSCINPAELPQICAAGTFSVSSEECMGHSECTHVPLGCYQEQAGQDSFKMCPNGFYCPDPSKSPVECPAGTTSSSSELCVDHSKCQPIGEKAQAISMLYGQCSYKSKTNTEIKKIAGPKSLGLCAKYVREAVQRAKGIAVEPTGIASAKDYGPWLVKNGYSKSSKTYEQATTGDIAVLQGNSVHIHGHITVKCDDGHWRSDFVQNAFWIYSDGFRPSYVIYE